MPSSKPILVTGASGFVALHTIIQLLQQGYKVRSTLRTLSRETEVRETIGKHVESEHLGEILESSPATRVIMGGLPFRLRGRSVGCLGRR